MSDVGTGQGEASAARLPAGLHRRRHDGDVSLLAAHLGAVVVSTPAEVDALLAERLPATADQLEALAALAARAQTAARLVERTRIRAASEVSERLARNAGSAMAIHPETYRDAAARVVEARQSLARATYELADRQRATTASQDPPPDLQPPGEPSDVDEAQQPDGVGDPDRAAADMDLFGPDRELDLGDDQGRRIRSRTIGAIAVALGLGLVVFGLGVVPLWVALLPTLVVCLVLMWLLRDRGDGDESADADELDPEASALLADVAAATDAAFGGRRQTESEPAGDRQLLVARRDRAEEDLRVAERAWYDLAGPDAAADDVDEVIRRRDPQHQEALVLAAETATVRAATALLDRSRRRWAEAWSDLGLEVPDELDQRAVDDLVHAATRPILVKGDATPRATEIAESRPQAAVVVLERAAEGGV